MNANYNLEKDGFSGLGIAPALLDVLARLHFKTPTPIQKKSIPIAIEGKDIIGVAQTGTGKTLAFGIPMIQRLNIIKGRGLIIAPTRELALQVDEALRKVGSSIGLRTAVLIGGASMGLQVRALQRNPHIIIVTPGRLNDFLQQKMIQLNNVGIVVLDEADRMLDMGFAPQIKKIFAVLPVKRQTMLFSATMPSAILNMARMYMKLPIQIEVAPTGTTVEKVTQEIFVVGQHEKLSLTKKILEQYKGSVLIFIRTKHGAKKLTRAIQSMGYPASEIHSNRTLNQRKEALSGFKMGKYKVLVATDIASRGIDVVGIELVLNYDLPENSEDYVHRIGRTARAGALGHAISFVTPDQRRDWLNIERLMRIRIPISKTPGLPPALTVSAYQEKEAKQERGRNSHRSFHSRRRRRFR